MRKSLADPRPGTVVEVNNVLDWNYTTTLDQYLLSPYPQGADDVPESVREFAAKRARELQAERETRVMGVPELIEVQKRILAGKLAVSYNTKREEKNTMERKWQHTTCWEIAKAAFERGEEVELRVIDLDGSAIGHDYLPVMEFRGGHVTVDRGYVDVWQVEATECFDKHYRFRPAEPIRRSVEDCVKDAMEAFSAKRQFALVADDGEKELQKIIGVNDDFSYQMRDLDGRISADYDLGDDDTEFLTLDEAVEYLHGQDGKDVLRRRLEAL